MIFGGNYTTRALLALILWCPSGFAEPMGTNFFLHYIEQMRSLEGDYYQTVTGRKERVISHTHGHVMYKQPGLFRWLSQDNTLLVNDGSYLWQYEPDLEQVIKTPIHDRDQVFNPLILLKDVHALTEEYTINTEVKSRHGARFRLTPRKQSGPAISFIFRDDDLAAIEYQDNLQNINHIELKHLQHNQDIADNWFQFVPEEGTDIIEQ
jgi:outer membrane lipoprotein carrier protein